MAIQDFTAGQVLTAAQMDSLQANDYNQTVSTKTANYTLVAADKGTRVVMNAAGATTITVNTSLFTAGDTLQLQNIGAGVCTVTAGTATVSSAGPLAIPQYGSGTLYFTSAGVAIYFPSAVTIPPASSGLTLITAQTIGSAVSSVTVSSVFSATYDNYKIILSGGAASDTSPILLQLGATTSDYYQGIARSNYSNGAYDGLNVNNGANWYAGEFTSTGSNINVDLRQPFGSTRTTISALYGSVRTSGFGAAGNGFLNNATSYTAFTLSVNSPETMTGGVIRVYGYQNS